MSVGRSQLIYPFTIRNISRPLMKNISSALSELEALKDKGKAKRGGMCR